MQTGCVAAWSPIPVARPAKLPRPGIMRQTQINFIACKFLPQAEFNALAGDLARQYPDRARLWFAYDEPLR